MATESTKSQKRKKRSRRYYQGKRISKGELKIAQFFDRYNIKYIREKTFNDCINSNGNLLRFDFYLEQFNLLIEYQGQHHEKPINKYRRAQLVHKKTVQHDLIKKQFVFNNQINLIEIYYINYDNIDQILSDLLEEIVNECSHL